MTELLIAIVINLVVKVMIVIKSVANVIANRMLSEDGAPDVSQDISDFRIASNVNVLQLPDVMKKLGIVFVHLMSPELPKTRVLHVKKTHSDTIP